MEKKKYFENRMTEIVLVNDTKYHPCPLLMCLPDFTYM